VSLKPAAAQEARSFFQLNLELHLGLLYWELEMYDEVLPLLDAIKLAIESASWSPGPEFKMAAVLLGGMGHDDEARAILMQYEKFYDARVDNENQADAYNRHWMLRIDNWASLAQAQARVGHREAARETLRDALVKARRIPVERLNKVYGVRTDGLGEGNALQSAGLMAIVWNAAKIGETAIANEAYEASSPLGRSGGAPGVLIAALAKNGELGRAAKILRQHQCLSVAITLGLLQKHDWAGAIHTEETQSCHSKDRKCHMQVCGFDSIVLPRYPELLDGLYMDRMLRVNYLADLAKARFYVQGESPALTWARAQPKPENLAALTGIIDALEEMNREPVKKR